jgi:hypothetical protein
MDISQHTWKTIPDEMMGVVPSSIRVPLLLAIIILSQYSGSEVSEETMPNSGIWLITKKISRVNCVPVSACYCSCIEYSIPLSTSIFG